MQKRKKVSGLYHTVPYHTLPSIGYTQFRKKGTFLACPRAPQHTEMNTVLGNNCRNFKMIDKTKHSEQAIKETADKGMKEQGNSSSIRVHKKKKESHGQGCTTTSPAVCNQRQTTHKPHATTPRNGSLCSTCSAPLPPETGSFGCRRRVLVAANNNRGCNTTRRKPCTCSCCIFSSHILHQLIFFHQKQRLSFTILTFPLFFYLMLIYNPI